MKKDCIFCKFINSHKNPDMLFQNKNVYIMLDADRAVKGHVLVIWKKHVLNLSDLSEVDYSNFSKVIYKTEKILLKVLRKKRSIIVKSGLMVEHFHFHIYPTDLNITWDHLKDILGKKVTEKEKNGEKEKMKLNITKALSDLI